MPTPSRSTLREWTAALTLNPLDPASLDENRYVPLSEAGRGAVDQLGANIELSAGSTTQLLSGPSGSGKTTELNRLRGTLIRQGYVVAYVDMKNYLSMSSPIDVTEFLVALGVAVDEAFGLDVGARPSASFATRFARLLGRLHLELAFAGFTLSLDPDEVSAGAFGAALSVRLRDELRSSRSFVDDLRERLAYHLGELYAEVAGHLASLAIASFEGIEPTGVVLIVDGLDRLRGDTANDPKVQESIERLFVLHADKLKFARLHLIYTVPVSLRFVGPGTLDYTARLPVPIPHVTPRPGHVDGTATVEQVRAQLATIVGRRLPIQSVFGSDSSGLDAIISASGGHLRELFNILQRMLAAILVQSLELPVTPDVVEQAIADVANGFTSITKEQAAFLRQIEDTEGLFTPAQADLGVMILLLETHMLLGHKNGTDWYEVHPLARRALGIA